MLRDWMNSVKSIRLRRFHEILVLAERRERSPDELIRISDAKRELLPQSQRETGDSSQYSLRP